MPAVQDLAKRIIDKWSRMIFSIQTTYYDPGRDEDDDTEADPRDQYKRLRRKIDRMKESALVQRQQDEDQNEDGDRARKKARTQNNMTPAQQ